MTFEAMLSPILKPGDRVRLVSPASFPERAWVEESLNILERWGLVGEVGSHAQDRFGYMAGTDDDRLADLNDAFRDPGVRAIVTTRGGAGAYRIADKIDFAAVSADPKPLVGVSDITHIHLALMRHCGLAGIHGSLFGEQCQPSVRQLLMTTDPVTLHRDPDAVSATINVPGQAKGPLIGGNLAMLATSVGLRVPDLTGAILFLEDQRVVGLGTIDRQLTQLIASGTLDGIVRRRARIVRSLPRVHRPRLDNHRRLRRSTRYPRCARARRPVRWPRPRRRTRHTGPVRNTSWHDSNDRRDDRHVHCWAGSTRHSLCVVQTAMSSVGRSMSARLCAVDARSVA